MFKELYNKIVEYIMDTKEGEVLYIGKMENTGEEMYWEHGRGYYIIDSFGRVENISIEEAIEIIKYFA